MIKETTLHAYLNGNSNYTSVDKTIVKYYQCDILHCPLRGRMLTRLQLVEHFYRFHRKLTLARWHAMAVAKEQDRRQVKLNVK